MHCSELKTLSGSIIPLEKYTKRNLTFVVRRELRHSQVKSFYVARVKFKNYKVMAFQAYRKVKIRLRFYWSCIATVGDAELL